MKKWQGQKVLYILIFAMFITACGGGGSSSSPESIDTIPGTTQLSQTDESSITGTYQISSLDFYFTNGEHFSSSKLDFFRGLMTMNMAADVMTYVLEWRDSQYGDFYEYGESSISGADPDATWDSAYYEIAGDYSVVFYYDNFCSNGYCANATMRMQKISDDVQSLLSKGAFEKVTSETNDKNLIISDVVRSLSF